MGRSRRWLRPLSPHIRGRDVLIALAIPGRGGDVHVAIRFMRGSVRIRPIVSVARHRQ